MNPGPAKTLRLVCPHDCPDTCGLVVTVENGRASKLRGDPDHPFTQGFLCQKVARYLDRVYHPERRVRPFQEDNALKRRLRRLQGGSRSTPFK